MTKTNAEHLRRNEDYTRSAEGTGKMLTHLKDADCFLPSARLFEDGSGHFIIEAKDETTADEVFERFLGGRLFKSTYRYSPDIAYDFGPVTFNTYREECPECGRPLEDNDDEARAGY